MCDPNTKDVHQTKWNPEHDAYGHFRPGNPGAAHRHQTLS